MLREDRAYDRGSGIGLGHSECRLKDDGGTGDEAKVLQRRCHVRVCQDAVGKVDDHCVGSSPVTAILVHVGAHN